MHTYVRSVQPNNYPVAGTSLHSVLSQRDVNNDNKKQEHRTVPFPFALQLAEILYALNITDIHHFTQRNQTTSRFLTDWLFIQVFVFQFCFEFFYGSKKFIRIHRFNKNETGTCSH